MKRGRSLFESGRPFSVAQPPDEERNFGGEMLCFSPGSTRMLRYPNLLMLRQGQGFVGVGPIVMGINTIATLSRRCLSKQIWFGTTKGLRFKFSQNDGRGIGLSKIYLPKSLWVRFGPAFPPERSFVHWPY